MRPVVIPPKVKLLGTGLTLCGLQCLQRLPLSPHSPETLVLSGMLGTATSLFLSKMSRLQANIHIRDKQQTGKELVNHDLTRLVGESVAAILGKLAQDKPNVPQLLSLSDAVRAHWVTYVTNQDGAGYFADDVNLTPVSEAGLIELFSTDREAFNEATTLTPEEWGTILRSLVADKDTEAFEDAIAIASAALPDRFANAVREKLKDDAVINGKAYAALQLSLMGELFAVCKNLEQQKQSLTPEVQTELHGFEQQITNAIQDLFAQINARFGELSEAQQEWFTSTRDTFEAYGLTLGAIHETVGRVEEHTRLLPEMAAKLDTLVPAPELWDGHWNVRFGRNGAFTGREDQLTALEEALNANVVAALTQPQAINGMGGVGKTQTAVEFAYRNHDTYSNVFWLNADSEGNLRGSLAQLARVLNLPGAEEADQSIPVNAALAALNNGTRWPHDKIRWLLIYDNADNLPMVKPYLPTGGKGHILLTTRAQATGTMAQSISIKKMSEEQGALLLLRRAKYLDEGQSLADAKDADRNAALELSRAMDGLPLALDQAGAYIQEKPVTPTRYLELYLKYRKTLLAKRGNMGEGDHVSVAVTFQLALQQVEQDNAAAAELVRFCAFLAPDAIPEELFVAGAEAFDEPLRAAAQNELEWEDTVEAVCRYSLLAREADARTFSLHRLIQEVLRDEMEEDEARRRAAQGVEAMNTVTPDIDIGQLAMYEPLLPHWRVCVQHIEAYALVNESVARLLNQAGYYLQARAQYTEAEPLYVRALAIYEQVLGPQHPNTATSLNNLALLYDTQSRYAEAEPLYVRALAIHEAVLGPQHPNTATSVNNLAELYRVQGRYDEAEPLYERALAIHEAVLGPQHPNTATSVNNLALLYRVQGRYDEAEPLYERALAIREDVLGPQHPDTAQSLNNLAELYRVQGRYDEAEPLYERALAIREDVLGPQHPDTAQSLNNLAALYRVQGRYDEAEPLFRRALAIHEAVLGPQHPNTAQSLNNLALLYDTQSRYDEAEPLLRRVVEIVIEALGLAHPNVALCMNNYAILLNHIGREDEAQEYENRAAEVQAAHERLNAAPSGP